jgi:hypothetical protein
MITNPLFPGQQENEKISLIVRQHWMVFFMRFITWLLFAAFLPLSDWAIAKYTPGLNNDPYINYINLIQNIYLMFLMLGLFILWIIYYLNIQIITDERIVDITQNSLLSHTISELHLSHIEDVTAEITGVFGTFLNYGNVYVQTAGETERFIFVKVPDPAGIEKLVLDLYEKLPEEQKQRESHSKK